MSEKDLDGWAINRIPPQAGTLVRNTRGESMSLISVSDVILQKDFVGYVRRNATNDRPAAFKL